MKKIAVVLIMSFFTFIFAPTTQAKVLPQASKAKPAVAKNPVVTGISVIPRLRADRRALIVNFANLQNARSVSYLLTYRTNTQQEGAGGAITLSGSSASQELLFGTCSKNVCRYHTGINNMRLEVSYTTQSGKKYLKRYKIQV